MIVKNLNIISFLDCSVVRTEPFGVITSHGYPQPYRNGLNCTWLIQVLFGHFIELEFIKFELQQDPW